jgi:hypothetical protein
MDQIITRSSPNSTTRTTTPTDHDPRLTYHMHTRPTTHKHATASDKCQQEKRKTINGDDLLWAMSTLGFDKYVEPLKLYLAKYREVRAFDGNWDWD